MSITRKLAADLKVGDKLAVPGLDFPVGRITEIIHATLDDGTPNTRVILDNGGGVMDLYAPGAGMWIWDDTPKVVEVQ